MDLTDNKNLSEGKKKALELAEDSRETEWQHPSFVAELFQGRINWDLIHPFPAQSPEDKKIGDEFLARVEKVLRTEINPDEVDRTGDLPKKALEELAKLGCFALKIPKEYGGVGLSQANYNRVVHMAASYCGSTAVWLSAHQSIGVPQPLKLFGTEEQKKKYFPQFAKGKISAFALTEPEVGSDPARMCTTAKLTEDGQAYIVNGHKLWCTNGPVADIMIVMAQTPSKVVNGKEKKQITAFIVEKEMPGVETIHRCQFMGLKGIQNGLMRFNNVRVPKENVLGGEGQGLKIALTTLNTGRLTMPAAVLGGAKWCLHVSRKWANERVQWGHPIGKHEAVASKIAGMAATVFAMEAVTNLTAQMADAKKTDIRLEAAMAKLFCTEASWRIVDGTVQVRGGRGYETADSLRARGEKGYAVERMMRDLRINTIIEGTSQIMRLFMAREAMDIHVKKIFSVLSSKQGILKQIQAFFGAIGFYGLWYPKQFLGGVSMPKGGDIPKTLKSHIRFTGRTSKKLARNLFHAMMIYQQKLEKKQALMTRLINIGTDLFAISASCTRALQLYRENPEDKSPIELADLFCRQARRRIEHDFEHLFMNSDDFAYRVAQNAIQDKYAWLESDIILPQA